MKTNLISIRHLLVACFLLVFQQQIQAQCTGEIITLVNPSFEDIASRGVAPSGWIACQSGQSPDIQPGSFAVALPASNGLTYAGFYYIDTIIHPNIGTWQEGLSQQLPTTLKAGMEYHSSIDLSNSSTTDCGLEPGCAELEIWGGFSACEHSELLWSSGNITNYDVWQNYSVVLKPSANYTFLSIQIRGLGCSGMPYILVDNFAPIMEQYKINIDLTSNHDSVCSGNAVELFAVASNGAGNYTYNWNNGVANSSNITLYPAQTTVVSVIATDFNGCASTPANITVFTFLPLELKYVTKPVCEGDFTTLKLYGKGGEGNYQFKLNSLSLSGDSITFIPKKDMVYIATITDGCTSIQDIIKFNINPKPTAAFTFINLSDTEISFKDASSISVGKVMQWNWSFGDQSLSTFSNPVHDYSFPGLYNVIFESISDKGCKSDPFLKTLNISIKEELNDEVKNQTIDQVNNAVKHQDAYHTTASIFKPTNNASSPVILYIFNVSGVQLATINNPENNAVSAIHALSFPNGTYIYKAVQAGAVSESGKIVIIH